MRDRLRAHELHAPAHFDAEVLSALGRLHGSGRLSARQTETRLDRTADAPVERDELPPLVADAWRLRHQLRLVDALYVSLADRLEVPLVTTDAGMAAASSSAEMVVP